MENDNNLRTNIGIKIASVPSRMVLLPSFLCVLGMQLERDFSREPKLIPSKQMLTIIFHGGALKTMKIPPSTVFADATRLVKWKVYKANTKWK